jgi:hypothetical protein
MLRRKNEIIRENPAAGAVSMRIVNAGAGRPA